MRKSSSRFEGAGQGGEVQGVTCSDIDGVSACEEGHVVGSEAKFSCDVPSQVPTSTKHILFLHFLSYFHTEISFSDFYYRIIDNLR